MKSLSPTRAFLGVFYCCNGVAPVNGDSNKFGYHVLYVKSTNNCLNTRIVKIWNDFNQNYPERFRISVYKPKSGAAERKGLWLREIP